MKGIMNRAALLPSAQKTFTVPAWVLAFIQTFSIWQMGVIFYSSKVFTINGVTPLPVSVDTAALPIAIGYLAGTALAYFLPHRVGLWARVLTIASFVSILLMFSPLPETALVLLYYVSVFTCVTFISVTAVLVINVYSLKTALKDGLIASLLSAPFIALLHFKPFALDFRTFNIISAVIQVLIFIGLTRIPLKSKTEFIPSQRKAAPGEKVLPPVLLIGATFFAFTILCLCVLFSSTAAESVSNGISVYYLASAGWAGVFAWLHFKKKVSPFLLYTVFFGVVALGFILWLLPLPAVKPVSLVLQSASNCICNLAWFLAAVLFEKWNKRGIAPICILIALVTALVHSRLLDILRNSPAVLYSIYAGIALAALVIYFLTEPYFRRVWIDAYAGKPDADIGAPQAFNEKPVSEKPLTKRELEVLPLIVQGFDNTAIARMLFISENTVKTHVKNIFQKMDVHTRFELAVKVNRYEEKQLDK